MGFFIFIIAVALAGIAILLIGKISVPRPGGGVRDKSIRWMGACLLLLAGVLLTTAMLTIVPTRNVGVTTAFGRPTGTLSNGLHIIAPWESVTTYDATIQTYTGDMNVRIANGATAHMQVTVHWRIDPKADIQQLHLDWREFGRIQSNVVLPRLQNVLNGQFEAYDPLIALKEAGANPVKISEKEGAVKSALQSLMPTGVIVDLVQLPFVKYPDQVQNALNDFQKELAATQVAIQQKLTAAEQKAAIDILASANLTAEAFAQQCLIVTERLAQQGKQISLTWSCVAGSGQTVAVR